MRFTPAGQSEFVSKLLECAWLHGLTVGRDKQVYEAALGVDWRIDPNTAAVERAIESDALHAGR